MVKRKIIAVILIIIVLCSMCCIMSACPKKDKKYDVTIKVVCYEEVMGVRVGPVLEEFIFTPDTRVLYTEREYDGKRYDYFASRYSYPNHPEYPPDQWFSTHDGRYLSNNLHQGPGNNRLPYICEPGEYVLNVSVPNISGWKSRDVYLIITIK